MCDERVVKRRGLRSTRLRHRLIGFTFSARGLNFAHHPAAEFTARYIKSWFCWKKKIKFSSLIDKELYRPAWMNREKLERSVTEPELKSEGSMDEKQSHDSTAQNPMDIPQSRVPLHLQKTRRYPLGGENQWRKQKIDKIKSLPEPITSNSVGKMVCIVKSERPINPVTAWGLQMTARSSADLPNLIGSCWENELLRSLQQEPLKYRFVWCEKRCYPSSRSESEKEVHPSEKLRVQILCLSLLFLPNERAKRNVDYEWHRMHNQSFSNNPWASVLPHRQNTWCGNPDTFHNLPWRRARQPESWTLIDYRWWSVDVIVDRREVKDEFLPCFLDDPSGQANREDSTTWQAQQMAQTRISPLQLYIG